MDDTFGSFAHPVCSPSKLEINIVRKLKSFVFATAGLIVDPVLAILDAKSQDYRVRLCPREKTLG